MKTHVWCQELDEYAVKVKAECGTTCDFFILFHQEEGRDKNGIISPELQENVLTFSENEIKAIYQEGYYGIWLSNHWILMWFYQKYPDYKYYWSVEYDVRISGRTDRIWNMESDVDFLYVIGGHPDSDPKRLYRECYTGDLMGKIPKIFGMLQLARYSSAAIQYLDDKYKSNENGQDELVTHTLMKHSGLTTSRYLLQPLIGGIWTWDARYSNHNRRLYYMCDRVTDRNWIFHPIKPQ
jgi:hypothetical protein